MLFAIAFLITLLWSVFLIQAFIVGGVALILPILALVFMLVYLICAPSSSDTERASPSDSLDSGP